MMFNREKPVWYADKNAPSNAAKFLHKEGLIFKAAHMFKDSIRRRYIKGIVVKRQTDIWLDLDIANKGKGLLN